MWCLATPKEWDPIAYLSHYANVSQSEALEGEGETIS